MPTLNWIGKDKVVGLHNDVPFHVLEHGYGFTADGGKTEAETGSGNKIIHGDNLTALKSLLPEYEGGIDCIYIDPPYNTGEEKWVYNDNVNDPRIKKWFGEVVGKDGEDLSRHDKWCCMMYPRLRLLRQLLSHNGTLAISIGFHEVNNLYQICKDIFSDRQVVIVTVQTSGGKPAEGFNYVHEYVIFIVPRKYIANVLADSQNEYASPYHAMTLAGFNQVTRPNQVYPIYINKRTGGVTHVGKSLQELIDSGEFTGEKADFVFDYTSDDGECAVWPMTNKGNPCAWRLYPKSFIKDWQDGYVNIIKNTSTNNPNEFTVQYLADGIQQQIESGALQTYKLYKAEDIPTLGVIDYKTGGMTIPTMWTNKAYYTTKGSVELTAILEEKDKFPYPKPTHLIEDIISRISSKDAIILDSFAGSGTTAHAVLDLNKKDGGNRKFILIEMMDYADTITAERVKRVITGYPYKGEKKEEIYSKKLTTKNIVNGDKLLAEAQAKAEAEAHNYTKVSKPKIQDDCLKVIGTIVTDKQMPGLGGAFDYYELGPTLFDKDGFLNEEAGEDAIREYVYYSETRQHLTRKREEKSKYLLDTYGGTAYYFYYEPHTMTVLDSKSPLHIKEKADLYIIYADVCFLPDDYMREHHIIFKKIPRDIRKF